MSRTSSKHFEIMLIILLTPINEIYDLLTKVII